MMPGLFSLPTVTVVTISHRVITHKRKWRNAARIN